MYKLLTLGLALVLGVASCTKEPAPQQQEPELPALASGSVAEVTLKYGEQQRISVDGGVARVSFSNVIEGRCAKESCSRCFGGYATVTVQVQFNGNSTQNLDFHCVSCLTKSPQTMDRPIDDPQAVQGYTVSIIDLTELSTVNRVPKEQYTIRLFISK
ncbi:hypothetical protein [Hymenobacter properus]|uniref:Lipoprotein n=1 Tax=Hymenobacter properus TaxID=2791026 RepID=A0A931FJR3_9BACT|nr:hypothetical protein [Hymenobacter properus]MBF9143247.1 hypothetical protein [Hymenobacter properus]MBR7722057.1 hypothetical protein [Microvirga sp. SRT04]